MAVQRSSLPLVLGGTLLFGGLTFLLGLLVGANLAPPPAKPTAIPALPAAPALPAHPTAPPAAAPGAAPAPAAAAPVAPAAAPAPATAPAAGTPPAGGAPPPAAAPAKSGAAEPPAITPVKVKGLGYGPPPSVEPASALRGKLLQAAEVPAAPPATPAAADGTAAPAPPAAKEAPKDAGPALVYAVSLGRFLVAANAGRLLVQAQEKGYQPVVVVTDPPDPSGWMTVTLGPQADATAARRQATDALAQGFETWMVTWLAP